MHDSQQELAAAGNRLARRRGEQPDLDERTYGVFQPSPLWYLIDDQGEVVDRRQEGYVGTLRLIAGHVTPEIVAHEVVHLSMAIYRRRLVEDVQLGTDCGEAEEGLSYIVGRTFAVMNGVLHEMGVWC